MCGLHGDEVSEDVVTAQVQDALQVHLHHTQDAPAHNRYTCSETSPTVRAHPRCDEDYMTLLARLATSAPHAPLMWM